MNVESIIAAIIPIVATFERLGIDYYIGGSVVSSAYSLNWSAAFKFSSSQSDTTASTYNVPLCATTHSSSHPNGVQYRTR